MSNEGDNLTFWEHLDELRGTLLRIIGVTVLFGIGAFCFKELLFDIVLAPSKSDFLTYRLMQRIGVESGSSDFSVNLINIELAQQFIIHMKMALYAGLFCALPYILYALLRFLIPALGDKQRRYTSIFIACGYIMFIVGVAVCYFVIFPLTLRFLATYQVSSEVANMISLKSYISTFAGMNVALGLVFELPVLCWLLAMLGVMKSQFMRDYRRYAIVVILVLAAIITPTSDAFTLALVALPMWLLYEASIRVVAIAER